MGRRTVGAATLAGLLIVVASGCSGGSPGGGEASFVQRLRLIPASVTEVNDADSPVQVVMADLDRAAEIADLERPEGTDDPQAVVQEFLTPLTGFAAPGEEPPPVAALLPEASNHTRAASRQDEFAAEAGWSLVDVSWFAEYQVQPGLFTVMGGRFDEDRLDEALGEREDGVWRVGGDDLEHDVADRSVARTIGESQRLALEDGRLVVSRTTPPVEAFLDGGGDTLADDPVLRDMAEAMDDQRVYSVMLLAGGPFAWEAGVGATPRRPAEDELDVLPERFVGLGAGLAYEDDAPVAVLTYAHEHQSAAEANRDGLRELLEEGSSLQSQEPWSSYFSVEDVRVEQTTVVAELRFTPEMPPMHVYRMLDGRDGLALHR